MEVFIEVHSTFPQEFYGDQNLWIGSHLMKNQVSCFFWFTVYT